MQKRKSERDKDREFTEWVIGLCAGFLLIVIGIIFMIMSYTMDYMDRKLESEQVGQVTIETEYHA